MPWSSHNPEAAGSSPAPAINVNPYVIKIYNTTRSNTSRTLSGHIRIVRCAVSSMKIA